MIVYFSLGTNLGDKEQNLTVAVQQIEERIGKVISRSAFYATAPWGFESDNGFLNAAIAVETALPAIQVLDVTQEIERGLGRKIKSAGGLYSDRLIDIDLLLYGTDVITNERLTVPHPLMAQRSFVMLPLAEIAPHLSHPVLHITMQEILDMLDK